MRVTKVDQSIRLSELAFVFNNFYEMKSGAPYDYLIKIILVGDTGVGKTSFLLRFTEQLFDDASHIATIGKCDHSKTSRY
jgi:GTPase SAR1 family protein